MNILTIYKEKGANYVLNLFHTYFPFKFIRRKSILKVINQWRLYKKYKRKYRSILEERITLKTAQINRKSSSFKIWTLWLQGEEHAPELVKKCFSRMRYYYGVDRLVVLNEKTIDDYISVPDFIKRKYTEGNMSRAHYSDVVRAMLLCEYGGVWIDSTCLMTSPLPNEIFNSHLFVFKLAPIYPGALKISNWFIVSDKNSYIMNLTMKMLIEYWRTHNHIEYYFLFHIFFCIAKDANEETRREWIQMPFYCNDAPHMLKREILSPYKEERFINICRLSTIHKLSWKINNTGEDTYLSHILKSENI